MKRRVLITGATGGLGQHLAQALAKAGYELILNYRKNKSAAQKLAARLASLPPSTRGRGTGAAQMGSAQEGGEGLRALIIQADVTNPKQVARLFKQAGRVDILINNVGDFIYKPLAETSEEDLHNVIHSNLLSAWYCAKAALPGMRKRKFGRIINFGSAGCDQLTTRPMTTPYYIAKTGLLMLTKSLAREERTNSITVNMISPGVLPHGVRPPGAPIVQFDDISRAMLSLLKSNSRTTGAYVEISGGWRPE